MAEKSIRATLIVVSDRSAAGKRRDGVGPELRRILEQTEIEVVDVLIVADDREDIASLIRKSESTSDVVLTTGGTGFAMRDVTPEATRDVIEREAPGLAEAMRSAGLASTPMASLSRQVAGITEGGCLVVNLPGSLKGATQGLAVLLPVVPHAVAMIKGEDH